MDPQNRRRADRSEPIQEGREYRFRLGPAARRPRVRRRPPARLVVVSTENHDTLRPTPGTQLTLDPGGSGLELPVVLGR